MSSSRLAALMGAAVIIFLITIVAGLKLLPEPHSETDFLVVGSVATLLTLGVLFAVILTTWLRTPDMFFKRRPKGSTENPPPNVE